MALLNVVTYGDSILRKKVKGVVDFSDLPSVVADMFDTMYEEEGVGLAANQVGFDLKVMVVDITHTEEWDTPEIFVNGEIVNGWGESVMEEGCLSLPGIRVDVKRPEFILFRYQDLNGKAYEKEFGGLMARVIQHEMDHLNGVFIVDRISPLRRHLYERRLAEIAASSGKFRPEIASSGIVL